MMPNRLGWHNCLQKQEVGVLHTHVAYIAIFYCLSPELLGMPKRLRRESLQKQLTGDGLGQQRKGKTEEAIQTGGEGGGSRYLLATSAIDTIICML